MVPRTRTDRQIIANPRARVAGAEGNGATGGIGIRRDDGIVGDGQGAEVVIDAGRGGVTRGRKDVYKRQPLKYVGRLFVLLPE